MVESSEAIRRIFWRHRWLLLSLMILAAAAVVPLREHQPVNYAATAIIQGQGTTPSADTQVQAIESRVNAVATAPDVVHTAISQAKLSRDATQVARHEISVTPMGSSAIMVLKVTDPSSQVAVALAGSLANSVVSELNQLGIKDDPELASLSKTNSQLVSRRNQLLSQLGTSNASNASTSVPVQSLLSQLGAVEQELANNEAESQQVITTLTTETGASVVSVPTAAAGASRHVAEYGALAALLGLIIGLLIATIREVIRPTVAQPAAGARELGRRIVRRLRRTRQEDHQDRPGSARAPQPGRPPGRSRHGRRDPARLADPARGAGRSAARRAACAGTGRRRARRGRGPPPASITCRLETTRARMATNIARRSSMAGTGRSVWPPIGRPTWRRRGPPGRTSSERSSP